MCDKSYIDIVCSNGLIALHSCSSMMTSATKVFYICPFSFSAQIVLPQEVSTFLSVALNLCMMISMQSWSLLIFPIFVAVGSYCFIGFVF